MQGLVLVAPACDCITWRAVSPESRQTAKATGIVTLPSSYVEVKTPSEQGLCSSGAVSEEAVQGGFKFRAGFFDEAEQHCLLDSGKLAGIQCPVRILHGLGDTTVPPSVSSKILEALPEGDHRLTFLKVLHSLRVPLHLQLHTDPDLPACRMETTGCPARVTWTCSGAVWRSCLQDKRQRTPEAYAEGWQIWAACLTARLCWQQAASGACEQ